MLVIEIKTYQQLHKELHHYFDSTNSHKASGEFEWSTICLEYLINRWDEMKISQSPLSSYSPAVLAEPV